MFQNCNHLVNAPATLPATDIGKNYCYQYMFSGCTALQTAPVIYANSPSAGTQPLSYMFNGCSALNSIELKNMTAWPTEARRTSWVNGVAATGTFKCPADLGDNSTIARGVNACPTGWTVVNA